MVVAVVGVELEEGRLQLPSRWRRAAAGALVALIFLAVVFGVSNLDPGNVRNYAYNGAMALACALLLALVVLPDERTSRRPPLVRVLDSRVLTANLVIVGVVSGATDCRVTVSDRLPPAPRPRASGTGSRRGWAPRRSGLSSRSRGS